MYANISLGNILICFPKNKNAEEDKLDLTEQK